MDAGGDDAAWLVETAGNRVYVASTYSLNSADPWTMKVTAYNAATGDMIWEQLRPTWTPMCMTVVGDQIYFGGQDISSTGGGFLLALNGSTGAKLWNVMRKTFDLKPLGPFILAQHSDAIEVYGSGGDIKRHILMREDQPVGAAVFGDTIFFMALSSDRPTRIMSKACRVVRQSNRLQYRTDH